MKKGNTVIITLKTEISLQNATEVEVEFTQAKKEVLVKTGDSVSATATKVTVTLSPEDSLLFEDGRFVGRVVRASFSDGTILISTPMYRPFETLFNMSGGGGGTDTSDATVTSGSEILLGFTAYAKGNKYTGEIPNYNGTVWEGD